MSIYEKLLNIQNELKAPKGQYNNFGKYKYRNAEDILEAVKPLCFKYKATLILTDEVVLIGERYYVKATASLTDIEKELTGIEVTAYAREEESKKGMDGSQITGSSSSYARKYALNGLFNIDDTKDSDATNTGDKDDSKASKNEEEPPNVAAIRGKVIDRIQLASLESELKRTGVKTIQIVKEYTIPSLREMKLEQYVELMKRLEKIKTREKTDLGL